MADELQFRLLASGTLNSLTPFYADESQAQDFESYHSQLWGVRFDTSPDSLTLKFKAAGTYTNLDPAGGVASWSISDADITGNYNALWWYYCDINDPTFTVQMHGFATYEIIGGLRRFDFGGTFVPTVPEFAFNLEIIPDFGLITAGRYLGYGQISRGTRSMDGANSE